MPITTIAIIGSTPLGRRLAYLSSRASYRTILEDISISTLEHAIAEIHAMFQADPAPEPTRSAGALAGGFSSSVASANLTTAHSVEDAIRDADLILEAVPDEFEMKLELFTIFDKFAKPAAIFASTTNSFSIDDFAEMTICPDRCLTIHLVGDGTTQSLHLLPSRSTSTETLDSCREVARCMGLPVAMISGEHSGPAATA